MSDSWTQTERAIALLDSFGVGVASSRFLERCEAFRRLCSTWNLAAKLMSKNDIEFGFDGHVADSLSLVPYVAAWASYANGIYVDIGSGGGLPAIPIKLALPTVTVLLIERSSRKVEFLNQVVRQLALESVQIVCGDFPSVDLPQRSRLYTARATERPEQVDRAILGVLQTRDLYLAERRLSDDLLVDVANSVVVSDAFDAAGLRRGRLYRVTTTR
jgi:16S rRNA (guanine(527)-N(7))-methyltransferase RsmG